MERGKAHIAHGNHFFDHMLELVARHGALIWTWTRAAI